MGRLLLTHSLLAAWIYALKENPYEDMTSETDKLAEFMATLRREPTPTTEAMQNGIQFEDEITAIMRGDGDTGSPWYGAEVRIANILRGARLQVRAQKEITFCGLPFLLYGRLDALRSGVIYDTKFSKSYERGKYFDSTQHPVYLELVPEAKEFTYLVSNGAEVWTETYRRDETPSIYPIIADFVGWLKNNKLFDLYAEKWTSK